MNQTQQDLIGYSPVYAPSEPQQAPPKPVPTPRWGTPAQQVFVGLVWLAVGALGGGWVSDSLLDGRSVRQAEQAAIAAQAEAAELKHTLGSVGELVCR